MKFNIATLVATACASPLTDRETVISPAQLKVEDTLTDGAMIDTQPTMESVPDLKDFLSTLYGQALTDDQILSMLIGSTPSPQLEQVETTAASLAEIITELPEAISDVTPEKPERNDQEVNVDQELVHVLNAEMHLIESLKKTESELSQELRELQILKEQQNELLGGETIIDVQLDSSSAMTSISTVCMALVALLLL